MDASARRDHQSSAGLECGRVGQSAGARAAAFTIASSERVQSRILAGENVDLAEASRLANLAARYRKDVRARQKARAKPAPKSPLAAHFANTQGRVTAVSTDVGDLLSAGFIPIGVGTSDILLGTLFGANMNVTTDQAISSAYRPSGVKWRVRRITARNASISLTTAERGVYTAASKGGTALVAASQAYSALTDPTIDLNLTFAANITNAATLSGLFLSLTTAQGTAATADFYVHGELVF